MPENKRKRDFPDGNSKHDIMTHIMTKNVSTTVGTAGTCPGSQRPSEVLLSDLPPQTDETLAKSQPNPIDSSECQGEAQKFPALDQPYTSASAQRGPMPLGGAAWQLWRPRKSSLHTKVFRSHEVVRLCLGKG